MNTNKKQLNGIIVPMVTPVLALDKIDEQGTANLVEHMIKGGVHGIFALGSSGEAQSLTKETRHEFVKLTGRLINGRVPYLVGISDTSLNDALALADTAAKAGACALVATSPYYFLPDQNEVIKWYTALADASPLPVYMYNMPSCVKVNIAVDTVAKLASHPNIAGIKDSSANMTYFQNLQYIAHKNPGFEVFVGPEELTGECVLMGANGGVNGGGNLYPELMVSMYNAASAKNVDEVRRIQKLVMKVSTTLYTIGSGPLSYLQGLKAALSIKGICSGEAVFPFTTLDTETKEKVKAVLAEIEKEF